MLSRDSGVVQRYSYGKLMAKWWIKDQTRTSLIWFYHSSYFEPNGRRAITKATVVFSLFKTKCDSTNHANSSFSDHQAHISLHFLAWSATRHISDHHSERNRNRIGPDWQFLDCCSVGSTQGPVSKIIDFWLGRFRTQDNKTNHRYSVKLALFCFRDWFVDDASDHKGLGSE